MLGTCGDWSWWRPDPRGVSWGGALPTHPAASLLWLLYEGATSRPVNKTHATTSVVVLLVSPSVFFPSDWNLQLLRGESRGSERAPPWELFVFIDLVEKTFNMPRSFLVKKYFSTKKPYYRESHLESQTAFVPESFPGAELPTQNNSSALTCYPTSPFFRSTDTLPAPITPVSPSPLGPLDLSSSPSSSSGEEEEDGGRTSDPPSPDIVQDTYHCLHCIKSYSSLSALSHHQLTHWAPLQQTPSLPTETSARPAFHCKHCPKEYTSLGALKMHIRSHTLPCVCPTCGKAFSRPWLLRGHIRTHTGERPFACQHCNRAFADRSNLRAHLQTHSEVKKYQCGSCARTFSRMSLLHKHNASGCCPAS